MTPRKFVSIIAGAIVLCSATVIAFYITQIGFAKIETQGIRFGLTCLLAYSLIKGWNLGRWITIVLMGLAAIWSILNGIGLNGQPVILALGLVYGVCVAGLLTPDANRHFARETDDDIENKDDTSNDLKCIDCEISVNEEKLNSDQLLCPECMGRLEYV